MDIRDLQNRFARVGKSLQSKSWFSKGKWILAQHPFPDKNPDGVTLHVFKKHWFNEQRLGIHFESYLDLELKTQKKSYVVAFIEDHADELMFE